LTEDEAKMKWCPFARTRDGVGNDHDLSLNRSYDGKADIGARCLASGCMAWRWVNEVTGRGYCGLAGAQGL
jgi:hypothetical protein